MQNASLDKLIENIFLNLNHCQMQHIPKYNRVWISKKNLTILKSWHTMTYLAAPNVSNSLSADFLNN